MTGKISTRLLLILLIVFLFLAAGFSLILGAVPLPDSWPGLLWGHFLNPLQDLEGGAGVWAIVMDIRLPRVLAALLAGGALAVAGTLVQGIFRNPLAGPEILGISSGASLGAVLVILWGGAEFVGFTIPMATAAGALGAAGFIFLLARSREGTSLITVVLAGLALSGFLGGLIAAFLLVARPYEISQFVFWTLGGLEGRQWSHLGQSLILILPGLVLAGVLASKLDVLALGEDQAHSLGLGVESTKIMALGAVSLLTSGAVSLAGPVGFIGLITPHLLRILVGPGHRALIPASLLGGALLLLGADLLGRILLPPLEIKAGILTALLGSPYFLWLVVRRRRTL